MKTKRYLVMVGLALATMAGAAQTSSTSQSGVDTDIALLRSNLQADKTDIIGRTMQLTDDQAKAFWPLYRDYAHQQQVVGDQLVGIIKDYAAQYDTMDDAKAEVLMSRWINFDQARSKLRADYYPKFRNAIGAKQAVKFFQVDHRLNLIVDLQLADQIPIVQ